LEEITFLAAKERRSSKTLGFLAAKTAVSAPRSPAWRQRNGWRPVHDDG
jgi:hypothetical protein